MTSVVLFANVTEPLLLKLKEVNEAVDLEWLIEQGKMVSLIRKNVVRAERDDGAHVHVMVFPREYLLNLAERHDDAQYQAWLIESKIKPFKEHYAHGSLSMYVY
ncbi:hypothetical protein FDJ23_gp314 [Erwinia phage vB_EamM_Desertfox]|uniref:Uncharacterized protein n=2 Tax=Agricanvirus TaxID=1984776 RepID=A0A191ZCK8_9CAUD|nr:hypothetical protein FDI00_gp315 [Erwinia phage vB_EamM_Special G]YP_009622055.1 hypothetical protein FDJ23_gp314 [Erwinia phage vB_EamM_Desertfox]ANJ65127.1 hypothetical protein SPECIALG_316 [Erwinia phage vB_EamM_Special G]AUG86421.1 hypothetical protein DESERTFOX_314 [Erwinia phage vB_EamM_Desertfox]